jgi:hypothetical protein
MFRRIMLAAILLSWPGRVCQAAVGVLPHLAQMTQLRRDPEKRLRSAIEIDAHTASGYDR